jgi:NCAIR mutase (PurE)-related protein
MNDPFVDVAAAIRGETQTGVDANGEIRVDLDRRFRTGIPEVVLASHKRPDELVVAPRRQHEAKSRVKI